MIVGAREILGKLRAVSSGVAPWDLSDRTKTIPIAIGMVIAGAGSYGAVVGAWREPMQALFTGIKLPLVILLTTLGNALLNAMLAPLLGLQLNLRQSLMSVLFTFALAACLLGSLVPVAIFIVWNLPPLSSSTQLGSMEYSMMQLVLVAFIAGCGTAGNVLFAPVLERQSGSRAGARRVLVAWLLVNLLLGSQIAWMLRPYVWDPARPVEFVGRQYMRGSFYETVFNAVHEIVRQQIP